MHSGRCLPHFCGHHAAEIVEGAWLRAGLHTNEFIETHLLLRAEVMLPLVRAVESLRGESMSGASFGTRAVRSSRSLCDFNVVFIAFI